MKRKRILVIDDEVSFTRLLKLNLEQTGEYEVRAENRAEAAVAVARVFQPDLILLDVMMPRMVGSDVAARLQADACLKGTPIVFLSAAVGGKWPDERDDITRCVPFIAKPASVEDVLGGIEQELGRNRPTEHGVAVEETYLSGYGERKSPSLNQLVS